MKPLDVCFNMIRASIALVVLAVLFASIAPTVAAVGSHVVRSHSLTCQAFSVDVPLSMNIISSNCKTQILLEHKNGILFDPYDGGGLLIILPFSNGDTLPEELNGYCQNEHAGKCSSMVPFDDRFPSCFQVRGSSMGDWIQVICVDKSHRTKFEYFGSSERLGKVASLIHLRP